MKKHIKNVTKAALLSTAFFLATPDPANAFAFLAPLIGAALGTAAAVATGAIALSAAAGFFLVNAALGLALSALAPKPKVPDLNRATQSRGYLVTQTGSALDHQVVYGKARIAGVRVFDETTGTDNKFLHRVIAFAGHEIEAFDEIYINDEVVTLDGSGNVTSPSRYNGFVRINKHLGASDQLADSDLVSEVSDWTTNHRLRGIAYLYIRLKFDTDVFPNGVPEITATIKGKKVYDPKTDTTAWSDNPALILRDYITSGYGLGEEVANVDDTLVQAAANVCDETDTLGGDTRYTCNGAFLTSQQPYDTINDLLSSMGGLLWYAQGKWRMKPAYWTDPVITLTEDDLRGPISIQTRHSRRDNFNTIRGTFRGPESNWQPTDYQEVTSAAYLEDDNNQESVLDFPLNFTDSFVEARRIARIALERNRQQLTIQGSFGLKAFQVQVGDVVNVTNSRMGWTNKPFEVSTWTFGLTEDMDLQVQMTLRETAESIFDEVDDGATYEADNTTLLSPFDVPTVSIPQNSVASRTRVIRENVSEIISFSVTSGRTSEVDQVEVQYKEQNDVDWIALGVGQLGTFELVDPELGAYQFRARAINAFGVRGEWAYSAIIDTANSRIPPQNVSGFSYEVNGNLVNLEWEATQNFDLSYYRIRHAVETSGATWANATTAVDKISRPATSITLPSREGTYMIRAFDKTGIGSEASTAITVTSDEVPSFTNSLTQSEHSIFSGTKLNCEVENSELVISPDLAYEASSADGINYQTFTPRSNKIPEYDYDIRAMTFKPDGTRVYYLLDDPSYFVQYDLQVPFELGTMIPTSEKTFSFPEVIGPTYITRGLSISNDGKTVFVTNSGAPMPTAVAGVLKYTLETAWDISTAVNSGDSFEIPTTDFAIINGIAVKPDGTEIYVGGNNVNSGAPVEGSFIRQYSLSTAWDITTASLTASLNLAPEITGVIGRVITISPTGDRIFASDGLSVYGYTMSTPWDLSTASHSSGDFATFETTDQIKGALHQGCFDDIGSKLFMATFGFVSSVKVSNALQTTMGQSATYTFSNYIETHDSAVRKVRARVDASVDRLSRTTGFDELIGSFDFLDGLFDDLSVSTQSGDTNLLFYISTTEDDPSGTPTWSEYKKFRCGEFYGRAFRFQTRLISAGTTVTPSIETLTAFVEYD